MNVIHLLDDVASCSPPSEYKQSDEGSRRQAGNGGGGRRGFLPVVSCGGPKLLCNLTFIQSLLFSCRTKHLFISISLHRQKYTDHFPFSIAYSYFLLNFSHL